MNTNERQRTPTNVNKSPFENPPRIPEKIQWVKPAFVCEVAFAEWTLDGGDDKESYQPNRFRSRIHWTCLPRMPTLNISCERD